MEELLSHLRMNFAPEFHQHPHVIIGYKKHGTEQINATTGHYCAAFLYASEALQSVGREKDTCRICKSP